jgi:hypothetical protein
MRCTMMAAVAACLCANQWGWSTCTGDEIRLSVATNLDAYEIGQPVEISVTSVNVSDAQVDCMGVGGSGWWIDIVAEDGSVVDGFSQPDSPWGQWNLSWRAHAYRELGRHRWGQTYHGEDLGRWDEPVPPGRYRVDLRFEPLGDGVIASIPFLICDAFGCDHPAGSSMTYIPAVANTTGFNGTRWRTELVLEKTGPSVESAEVLVTFLERGKDNRDARTALVEVDWHPPVKRIENVLQELFGLEGGGALRVTALDPGVIVSSRAVATTSEGGEFGTAIPAVDPRAALPPSTVGIVTDLEWAPRMSQTGVRTNLGLLNVGAEPATVEILFAQTPSSTLFSPLGDLVRVDLPPYGHRQLNDVLAGATTDSVVQAFAVLRSIDGAGVIAYGAVVDNATGDTRYRPASVAPEYLRPSGWDDSRVVTPGATPAE